VRLRSTRFGAVSLNPARRADTRFNSTPFGHFCSLIAEIRLSSGTETFYSHVINKMSTTEDLSIKPYMFEPESERDENKDDEPAE
jgi:hypothetical protein